MTQILTSNAKKKVVISAVNLIEAGPLTILKEVLIFASRELINNYEIIAIVHDKALLNIAGITYYEFPDSKKSWLKRLYYEYFYFEKISKEVKPYLWLSLHDMTPRVETTIQAVYCHNTSPYYKLSFNDMLIDFKFVLFNFFYKYLYKINVKSNDFMIVQQDWFRNKLAKNFAKDRIIVAHPNISCDMGKIKKTEFKFSSEKYSFFYPTFPRFFKNLEAIIEATILLKEEGINDFEVYLTIKGDENSYAKKLYKKYKAIDNIKFLGLITREEVFEFYAKVDSLIFPSKLESWGLPITEFKSYDKPILVADLAYAHETVGAYNKVKFFDPDNSLALASLMREFIIGKLVFEAVKEKNINQPFASNWAALFDILLKKDLNTNV